MYNEETLWMGDLESWMNASFIMNSFIKFGFKPINVKIIIDKRPNKNQNFCFVTFNNLEEANNALFKLNGKQIPNTSKFFKLNLTKKSSVNQKIIFVGNLPDQICHNDLYNYFKPKYTSVISASIISDDNISRGYGFVHFTNEVEYQKCLKEMDGKLFNNSKINVRPKNNPIQINNKFGQICPIISNNKFKCININNQNKIIAKYSNIIQIDSSTISSKDNKKENLLSLNSNGKKKQAFLGNINLLKSNDNIELKELKVKIQESIDKMIEYYKNIKKMNEIPKMILYFSSNQNI